MLRNNLLLTLTCLLLPFAMIGCGSGGSVVSAGNSNGNTSRYALTDLGPLGTNLALRSVNVNTLGQVAFTVPPAPSSGRYSAVLYTNGSAQSVGSLGGDTMPAGINQASQIVGASTLSSTGAFHAFLAQNGTIQDLGTINGSYSAASAINSSGQIAGSSSTQPTPPNDLTNAHIHAFLYSNGKMTDLGTLPGRASSFANGINDLGQIVGASTDTGQANGTAFLYSNGIMQDLGSLGGSVASAESINNKGQVVGYSYTPVTSSAPYGYMHAFLWQNGKMADLGTLGGTRSQAMKINNTGLVVGGATTTPGSTVSDHAFLYDNGKMLDLNTLIPANTGWVLNEATDITDTGLIAGIGTFHGSLHAYLLTPR